MESKPHVFGRLGSSSVPACTRQVQEMVRRSPSTRYKRPFYNGRTVLFTINARLLN
jgi:hypothetical protein